MNPLSVIEIGLKLIDKIIPDKDAREQAQAELIRAAQEQDLQLALGQIKVNETEAQSPNLFVSGWRPAVGWICVAGLSYNFVIYPLLLWLAALAGAEFSPPPLLSESLMELVLGMLGLGALRTVEKWRGVAR